MLAAAAGRGLRTTARDHVNIMTRLVFTLYYTQCYSIAVVADRLGTGRSRDGGGKPEEEEAAQRLGRYTDDGIHSTSTRHPENNMYAARGAIDIIIAKMYAVWAEKQCSQTTGRARTCARCVLATVVPTADRVCERLVSDGGERADDVRRCFGR